MALPPNYDPMAYQSPALSARLGLKGSYTPSLVQANWQAIMEWWQSMRNNPKWHPHVAPAQTALTEARDKLVVPGGGTADRNVPDPASPKSNIMLIGGPGAGKSAIIGGIYDICQRGGIIDPLQVRFSPDTRSNVLQNLEGLKRFCNPQIYREGKVLERVANPSNEVIPYNLIVRRGGKDLIQLKFIDTSGEDLQESMNGSPFLAEEIKKCHAAILVVDALALRNQARFLEEGLSEANRRNMPENVEAIVQDWLSTEPEAPRLLCIVPIKIESLIYDQRTGQPIPFALDSILSDTVKEFEGAISYLIRNGNCAVVVSAVETCGALVVAPGWSAKPVGGGGDYPKEEWDRLVDYTCPPNPRRYAPISCELPLVYILNFFLTLTNPGSASSSPADWWNELQLPPAALDFVERLIGRDNVDRIKHEVTQFMDRGGFLVKFVSDLLGFGSEDNRRVVMNLMKKSVRFDGSVRIFGNTKLLTL